MCLEKPYYASGKAISYVWYRNLERLYISATRSFPDLKRWEHNNSLVSSRGANANTSKNSGRSQAPGGRYGYADGVCQVGLIL